MLNTRTLKVCRYSNISFNYSNTGNKRKFNGNRMKFKVFKFKYYTAVLYLNMFCS